jgi:hypothetical protein
MLVNKIGELTTETIAFFNLLGIEAFYPPDIKAEIDIVEDAVRTCEGPLRVYQEQKEIPPLEI